MKLVTRTLITFAISLLTFFSAPSIAITDGELDGDRHPAVVLIVMDLGGTPLYRCSGVLISPKHVLTAGHCVNVPPEYGGTAITSIRVFTESDVQNGNNNYPYGGGRNTIEAASWSSHPDYNNEAYYLHDVGVITLKKPVILPKNQYATLPRVNKLDALASRRGTQDVSFTAVGYGYQRILPYYVEDDAIRMVATPNLVQINTGLTGYHSLLLSNNHSTGGTCFGDSGGPNFIDGTLEVGGITSFGLNGICAGTGGVFRVDRTNVLEFIYDQIGQ